MGSDDPRYDDRTSVSPDAAVAGVLDGLRVLLVARDVGIAELLATQLRERHATVVVCDADGDGLLDARDIDPVAVVFDPQEMDEEAVDIARRINEDPRLRWASTVRISWERVWPFGRPTPDLASLAEQLAPALEGERALRARFDAAYPDGRVAFDVDRVGPSRSLRVLRELPWASRVSVRGPGVKGELVVADGEIASAHLVNALGEPRETRGDEAVRQLVGLRDGRMEAQRTEAPLRPTFEEAGRDTIDTTEDRTTLPTTSRSGRSTEERPTAPDLPSTVDVTQKEIRVQIGMRPSESGETRVERAPPLHLMDGVGHDDPTRRAQLTGDNVYEAPAGDPVEIPRMPKRIKRTAPPSPLDERVSRPPEPPAEPVDEPAPAVSPADDDPPGWTATPTPAPVAMLAQTPTPAAFLADTPAPAAELMPPSARTPAPRSRRGCVIAAVAVGVLVLGLIALAAAAYVFLFLVARV